MPEKVTVAEVAQILKEKKETVRELSWEFKNTNHTPKFIEYRSAIRIKHETVEDLFICFIYRAGFPRSRGGKQLIQQETIATGLYFRNKRVFAIDYDTNSIHLNKIGLDIPSYKREILGLHRHIWTENGYGYAEEIRMESVSIEGVINLFLKESNINLLGGFKPLPSEQFSLL